MPTKCCVPRCRSNYNTTTDGYVTVYSFPRDPDRREQWLRAIHRDNFQPGATSAVCIKHFSEEHIVREDRAVRSDGSVLILRREIPKLTDDAVPSKFPNQPSYMSSIYKQKCEGLQERRKEEETEDEDAFRKWVTDDVISDFNMFKSRIQNMKIDGFTVIINDMEVVFLKIDCTSEVPKIIVSLKINNELRIINISHNDIPISSSKLDWLLGSDKVMDKWSKFDTLLNHLKSYNIRSMSPNEKLELASNLLGSCCNEIDESFGIYSKVKFLKEQVSLLRTKAPKYSTDTLDWASLNYFSNPSAYRRLWSSKVLTIPHPEYLRQLSHSLSPESIHCDYLKHLSEKAKTLEDHEKVVNLILEETDVKSADKLQPASTVQAFVITSLLSNNKDIVRLFPGSNLTSEKLYEFTLSILDFLNQCGFRIITLILHNYGVNRNMVEKLCNGQLTSTFKNPFNINEDIFILFDKFHLLKSIRNNRLNGKDNYKSLLIPAGRMSIFSSERIAVEAATMSSTAVVASAAAPLPVSPPMVITTEGAATPTMSETAVRGTPSTTGIEVIDMIKTEPEIDALSVQTSDNRDTEEKQPLSEYGNSLDLHLSEINEESLDHSYELKSEITVEEGPAPVDFPVVKSEAEKEFCDLDQVKEETTLKVTAKDNEVSTESIAVIHNNGMPSYFFNIAQDDDAHGGRKIFKCDVCGKQVTNLTLHARVHTGEKPYRCDTCGKYFSLLGNLRKHLLVHTGEKPFSCDLCGKSFSQSVQVKQHATVHTGEKAFTCVVCGKNFAQSGYLRKHIRLHTGQKPFKCDICGKVFSFSEHLTRHKRSHTGEKQFQCDICGNVYAHLIDLKRHVVRHDGEMQ
ncbi:uncharacterized protein [Periplaneta americana]|uniref:uncharacterized protein isoform X2 n=1 Tax=Periplaneta americana TaxID=6978 RepID=UPI0037E7A76A